MKNFLVLLSFILIGEGGAFWVGNPASPTLYKTGFLFPGKKSLSLRAGYIADFIYDAKFQGEKIEMSTYAGIITLNVESVLDVYGVLGGSKLEKPNTYLPRRASWALGARIVIYQCCNFFVGGDVVYFYSDQKPEYFLIENVPATVNSNYAFQYNELQGAISLCYRCGAFLPYLGATYLSSQIQPSMATGVVDFSGEYVEFISLSTITNSLKLGMILGLSILSSKMLTLDVEGRFINQNAVNISGQIRF